MLEVERKYRVQHADFAGIMERLFKKLLTAKPVIQQDAYLCTDDPKLTLRVRREKSQDGSVYLRTEKRKAPGANTNEEVETVIDREEYLRLISMHQATAYETPLRIRKHRIHFYGSYGGLKVTICLDCVNGPGIDLGHTVELETMVASADQVATAHAVLKALAVSILPSTSKREKRGYRTMLMEELTKREKRRRKAADKAAAKKQSKRSEPPTNDR